MIKNYLNTYLKEIIKGRWILKTVFFNFWLMKLFSMYFFTYFHQFTKQVPYLYAGLYYFLVNKSFSHSRVDQLKVTHSEQKNKPSAKIFVCHKLSITLLLYINCLKTWKLHTQSTRVPFSHIFAHRNIHEVSSYGLMVTTSHILKDIVLSCKLCTFLVVDHRTLLSFPH